MTDTSKQAPQSPEPPWAYTAAEKAYAHVDTDKLMPSGPAAEFLGISEVYLRSLRLKLDPEGPPYVQIGRRVLYRPSDLSTWLDSKVVTPATAFPAKKPKRKKAKVDA